MAELAKLLEVDGEQVVLLPEGMRFESQQEVGIRREGQRVILEPIHTQWSERFLRLAGSAVDFPDPDEPPPISRD